MKKLEFKDKSAKEVYDSYIKRVRQTITILSKIDKEDVLMEFNSHIFEGLQKNNTKNELENILKITTELGDPEVVLKPLIAEKKLHQATRTFNPKHIIQALFLNIKNGVIYSVFALIYICLFVFGILIILKMIYPNDTGLFLDKDGFFVLGRYSASDNITEVFGGWLIPTLFLISLALYIIITLMLKTTRKTQK